MQLHNSLILLNDCFIILEVFAVLFFSKEVSKLYLNVRTVIMFSEHTRALKVVYLPGKKCER